MRNEIIETAHVYLASKNMREAADKLGVSVWTIHHRLNEKLSTVHPGLHEKVRERIEANLADRARRGGHATLGMIKPTTILRLMRRHRNTSC